MATQQNCEPSKVIGSISKLAGTLVGTAVVTGKRIIGSVTPSSEGSSDKPVGKTMQAPAKTKKKKVAKRKGTGSSHKSKTSPKKPAPSPAKKKKVVTPKKKTASRKTKKKTAKVEGASHSQDALSS